MSLGTLTLHARQGEERFDLASATVTFQPNGDGQFASTFRIETAPPVPERCPETGLRRRRAWAEFTLPLPKSPAIALLTGKAYSLAHGIDPESGEELTNFYYYEHAPVDEVVITVVERFPDRAHLRLEGITPDPVVYNGSAPPAKIVIDGVFTLVFNRS